LPFLFLNITEEMIHLKQFRGSKLDYKYTDTPPSHVPAACPALNRPASVTTNTKKLPHYFQKF
jgi:hypothetical protein